MADCASCGEPIRDVAVICAREATRSAYRWRQAADLWPHVAETVHRQTRVGTHTPRPAGHDPPEPADMAASEQRDVVANVVSTWARHVAAETGADLAGTIGDAWRWLAGRADWIRYQPWAAEALDELDDAAALVWRVVDLPATRTRVEVGPCPELVETGPCPGRVVAVVPAREDRPAVMVCSGCAASWDTTQWSRLRRRILATMREAA